MGIRTFARRLAGVCRREGWVTRRLSKKLGLDESQQSRLRAVEETIRGVRRDAHEGWAYRRQALISLLSREHFDREEALRLSKVPMAMVMDALPVAVDRFAEFHESLSEEQRARLQELGTLRCKHGPF